MSSSEVVRILFATAELTPLATVGGLASASAGMVGELRRRGVEVEVVVPDYGGISLVGEHRVSLDVPGWAGPASARRGVHGGVGWVTLVDVPGIARSHPYVDRSGQGWWDNEHRFFAFSLAVADLVRRTRPDVVHLNDWHTAVALAALDPAPPSVFSIHNLAYQGDCDMGWVAGFGPHGDAFVHRGRCNPMAGAVRRADRVVVVSPSYRAEILTPEGGFGLDDLLRARGDSVVGILNGIDTDEWDPATSPYLPVHFGGGFGGGAGAGRGAGTGAATGPGGDTGTHAGEDGGGGARGAGVASSVTRRRAQLAEALCDEVGLASRDGLLLVGLTRLVHQKGFDLLAPLLDRLGSLPARLVVLGDGEDWVCDLLTRAEEDRGDRVRFVRGYDVGLGHRLLAGGDALLMPSRFEPCGLTQMQAMRYGCLPVVTPVGGLRDTVVDLDADPDRGTGFVAAAVDPAAILDAVRRAATARVDPARWGAAQGRAMAIDWSWRRPVEHVMALYSGLV